MPRAWYVYVPTLQSDSLTLGLDRGIWGWRRTTIERGRNKAEADRLRPGDLLTFGHRGPNSRVARGGWADAELGQVVVTEVVTPLYVSDEQVWPDDLYPYRVDFAVLDQAERKLTPEALEALRLSANKQGVPVVAEGPDQIEVFAEAEFGPQVRYARETLSIRRMEMSAIRRAKLGFAAETQCDLCGRSLPNALLRVVHIKVRSHSSAAEWQDLANVLVACNLGCDRLFELGHLYVDDGGIIRRSDILPSSTPDLAEFTAGLTRRKCRAHNAESAPYFTFHRAMVACA
jgi:hypothetical protein